MSDGRILEVIKDPAVFIEEVFGLKLLECQKILIRQLHQQMPKGEVKHGKTKR